MHTYEFVELPVGYGLWDKVEDLVYETLDFKPNITDLETLNRMMKETLDSGTTNNEDRLIGKCGEHLVNLHLIYMKQKSSGSIVNVEWIQEETELGTPYDFIVTIKGWCLLSHCRIVQHNSN